MPGGAKKKKKKKSRPHFSAWGYIWRTLACLFCLLIMACSVGGVVLAMYIVQATADDSELDLDNQKLKQATVVYAMDKDTNTWVEYAKFYGSDNRRWVDLEEMPDNLQKAVIAVEDKDFYNEPGVNIKRTIGAALNEFTNNAIYGRTTGASTIEQQLIKNLIHDDADSGIAGYMRKVREIFRAIGLCNRYSKDTILEAYLNTIPLTGQIYGMEVGANTYFGKTVSELTLSECAALASITNNPTVYNPFTNPENLITRRNHVLREMWTQGYISEEEYNAACAESITVVEDDALTEVATVTSNNSYFTDALFEDLTQAIKEEFGYETDAEAQAEILNGGLKVYSTVDLEMQETLERLMLNQDDAIFNAYWTEQEVNTTIPADSEITYDETGMPLEPNADGDMVSVFRDDQIPVYADEETGEFKTTVDQESNTVVFYEEVRTQAAAAVVDYDGQVLALVGGLGEKTVDRSLNRATVPHQTGSTAKPIAAYCLALDNNLITYSSQQVDSPLYAAADKKVLKSEYAYMDPYSAEAQNRSDIWRDWPVNYEGPGTGKTVLIVDALKKSMNTVAVRVGSLVGAEMMFNFVHDTLQCRYLSAENDTDLAPMVLGAQYQGLTSVELAAAYTIFYDGTFTTPHYFTEVYDYRDNLYLDNSKRVSTTQAIKPTTATIMNRLLQNVLTTGTAAGMTPNTENDLPAAAKTGTTSDYRDFTFAGLTPYFSMAVWWGYDQPQEMKVTSGKPTQVLWKQFCEEVLADAPYQDFPMAEGVEQMRYDTSTGSIVSGGGGVGYYTSDNLPESYAVDPLDPYAAAAQDAANAAPAG